MLIMGYNYYIKWINTQSEMKVLIAQNVMGVPSMDSQSNPNGQVKSFRETDIWTYIYSIHRDWAREIDSRKQNFQGLGARDHGSLRDCEGFNKTVSYRIRGQEDRKRQKMGKLPFLLSLSYHFRPLLLMRTLVLANSSP